MKWMIWAALFVGASVPTIAQVRGGVSGPGFVRSAPGFSAGPVIVGGPPVIVGGPRVIVGGPPVIVSGSPVIVRGPAPIVGGPPVIVGGPAPIVSSAIMGRPLPPRAPIVAPQPRPSMWIPGHWVRTGIVTRYIPGHFQ